MSNALVAAAKGAKEPARQTAVQMAATAPAAKAPTQAAAPAPTYADAPAAPKSKVPVIVGAIVALAVVGGGAVVWMTKKEVSDRQGHPDSISPQQAQVTPPSRSSLRRRPCNRRRWTRRRSTRSRSRCPPIRRGRTRRRCLARRR